MAQIDWTTISTTANAYSTSISGTAVQHSTLSNPITSSGTWFRNFQSNANNTSAIGGLLPINNSLLTSSLGYPYGFTYSLRALMRIDNSQSSTSRHATGVISFKNSSSLSAQTWATTFTAHRLKGYRIMLNATTATNPELVLRCARDENVSTYNSSLDAANNSNAYAISLLSIPDATWTRVRMDVMGLPDADRITVFTGSGADIWSQIHQVDIQRTKVGAYVPWYNNPSYPGDNIGSATAGYMGILYHSSQPVTPVRIDRFEVYREAITL
jgi:hypothetical protein